MCEYKVMVGVELINELLRKSGGEYPESRIPSVPSRRIYQYNEDDFRFQFDLHQVFK